MSDADNQMGGQGGPTGPKPAEQSSHPPDPVKGKTGSNQEAPDSDRDDAERDQQDAPPGSA